MEQQGQADARAGAVDVIQDIGAYPRIGGLLPPRAKLAVTREKHDRVVDPVPQDDGPEEHAGRVDVAEADDVIEAVNLSGEQAYNIGHIEKRMEGEGNIVIV